MCQSLVGVSDVCYYSVSLENCYYMTYPRYGKMSICDVTCMYIRQNKIMNTIIK